MKKNKKPKLNKTSESIRAETQHYLRRRQEKLKKEAEKKEKKRNAIFRRRIREASEKKAPKTLRTKAYYRFSKDYPNDVTPDGFRKNDPQKETLSAKSKLTVFILCLTAFIVAFTGVRMGIEFSNRDINTGNELPDDSVSQAVRALHITPDEFAAYTAEELTDMLNSGGFNSAVIELKSESGFVYFDSDTAPDSSQRPVYAAYEKVTQLQSNGITCIAYISCFKDTAAATSEKFTAVTSSDDITFFDSDGYAWLDPFAEDSKSYNLGLIRQAKAGGFSQIILDNVCFPTKYTAEAPVFLADASSAATKNTVLINFINDALKAAGREKLIIMCDTYGFYEDSETPNEKYGRALIGSECMMYAADLRLSRQDPAVTGNTELFSYVEEMPMVFILDAGNLAANRLAAAKAASNIYAVVEREPEDTYVYAVHSGIENTIIW